MALFGLARPMLSMHLAVAGTDKSEEQNTVSMREKSKMEITGLEAFQTRALARLVLLPARICALVILLPRLRVDGKPPVQRLWFPVTLLLLSAFGMRATVFGPEHFMRVGDNMDFWQLLTAASAVSAACWFVRFGLQGRLSGIELVAAAFRAPSATANYQRLRK
jgi:hypothetical protein